MTNEERELKELAKQGLSFNEIREKVHCSDSTIKKYISILRRRNPMEKRAVSKDAIRRVLEALNGPDHLIRELQPTRGPLVGDDNPINILVDEYNQQANS